MSPTSSKSLLLGSNLVSFMPGVPSQSRIDVLDALLLAELRASERYDREGKWEQWIETYKGVLFDLGFVARGSLGQPPVKVSNERGFRRETARLVRTISPPQLANVAQSGLDAMFNSEHAQLFFRDWFNFNSGRSDNFQIVPCERTESGQINIAVCGLQMLTRTWVKPPDILLPQWPFAYEMTLTLRGGGLVFDEKAYERCREQVRKELQAKASDSIWHIEL